MILENYYYYFEKVLSDEVCDMIMEIGKNKQEIKAGLRDKTIEKDLSKIRNSNIAWLDEKFIYDCVHPFVHEANQKAGWNFKWDYSESCQFTKYDTNQFYEWHSDQNNIPFNHPEDKNFHGKIRKLSVTVSLSNPDEYEGGNLEFDFRNNETGNNKKLCEEIRPRGSIVVFPSFVFHRVTPVTKGIRYSLVMWNLGYPYQ